MGRRTARNPRYKSIAEVCEEDLDGGGGGGETDLRGKAKDWLVVAGKLVLVLLLLYLFICSLDMLSISFRLLTGQRTSCGERINTRIVTGAVESA